MLSAACVDTVVTADMEGMEEVEGRLREPPADAAPSRMSQP